MKVVIFGRGKVGRTLAKQLRSKGVDVSLRSARGPLPRAVEPRSTFVLAVPDGEIASCAQRVSPLLTRASVVLHCAGARGPDELQACKNRGASVAGFHPLVSFASRDRLASLQGATFVAHGDSKATRAARALCQQLDAHCVVLPILGPAYHAAAALLANGAVALAFQAQQILVQLGMAPHDAERALSGMLSTVASNVRLVGLPQALTGPVVRRDTDTVKKHRRALHKLKPQLADAYQRVLPLIEQCARASWQVTASSKRGARQRQK